jgi:protein O-GlcNAc transferase
MDIYDERVVNSIIKDKDLKYPSTISETEIVSLINNTVNKFSNMSSQDQQINEIMKLIYIAPNCDHIYYMLGFTYNNQNKLDEARTYYSLAISHNNKKIDALLQLGLIYRSINNQTAIKLLERAHKLSPEDMRVLNTLAVIYVEVNRYEDGEKTFLKVVENKSTAKDVAIKCLSNLGTVTSSLGQNIKSIKYLCQAHDLSNGSGKLNLLEHSCANGSINVDISILQTKLLILNNIFSYELKDPELADQLKNVDVDMYIYKEHLKINDYYEDAVRKNPLMSSIVGRKIKIGYLSSDLRNHVVTKFLYDIIKTHNREKFEIYLYYNFKVDDHLAQEYKKLPIIWTVVYTMTDDETANKINEHKIDILIDLNGHTSGNRLGVFARKPAPVQITYLGYPNTTGLKEMDYRITDAITNSPDSIQKNSEKLLYLPCFIHYNPTIYNPSKGGFVEIQTRTVVNEFPVFAVINRPAKNSKKYFETCSKILKKLPNSKILIKVNSICDQSYIIDGMLSNLKITKDRLIIVEYVRENDDYYDLFNKVDILLDTFPYSGTTTTCDSLYMSTPVITLYNKNMHAHSVSSSIIKNIDGVNNIDGNIDGSVENTGNIQKISDILVANNIDEYVEKAVNLATNKELLSRLKGELRSLFLKSMEIKPFMENYESLLESTLV